MTKSELIRAASRIAMARAKPDHRMCLAREIVALAEEFAADDGLTIPTPPLTFSPKPMTVDFTGCTTREAAERLARLGRAARKTML